MDRSLTRFYAGIKTERTAQQYGRYLNYFLKFVKIKEAGGLLQLKDTAINEMVEDWVLHMKSKGLRANTIRGQISAVELYLGMNDRPLQNSKKIKKWLPAVQKATGSEAWTREDLRKMIDYSKSKRTRAIFYTFISTGCRLGAIPSLTIGDTSDMPDGTMAVLIYSNTNEEYYGYLTPPATACLKEYLAERTENGELLKPENPLFRRCYQVGVEKVRPMSIGSVRVSLETVIRKIRGKGDGTRTKIQEFHGIRKYFATVCKSDNRISWSVSEILLGHRYKLDVSYFKPTKENLWKEWMKVMDGLILSDEERLKMKNEQQEKQIQNMESEKDKIIAIQQEDIKSLKASVAGIWELLKD